MTPKAVGAILQQLNKGERGMNRRGGVWKLIGIGWFIALSLILPVFLGLWLDRKLNTGVIFTFVGLVVGLVLALVGVYRMLLQVIREGENKEKK